MGNTVCTVTGFNSISLVVRGMGGGLVVISVALGRCASVMVVAITISGSSVIRVSINCRILSFEFGRRCKSSKH